MDDNQNDRINPSSNPFNQSEIDLKEHYDEFGNRIVAEKPAEPSVTEILEEDLGITPTDTEHQKTASSADNLVSRTDSLNDWPDNLKRNVAYKKDIVKTSEAQSGMDLPGVEPGRLGLSDQSSEPARPMLLSV